MNPKLLILLAWIFYIVVRKTNDAIWMFCLVHCCVMVLCVIFYRMENKTQGSEKQKS